MKLIITIAVLLILYSPVSATCTGDCNSDGRVTIDELVLGVNIILGEAIIGQCLALECWDHILPCIIVAADKSLHGCPTNKSTNKN